MEPTRKMVGENQWVLDSDSDSGLGLNGERADSRS